jgi:hypothetical protein
VGSQSNGVGSWIQLNWTRSVQLGRVVLVDGSKAGLGITGASITLSDGSTVPAQLTVDAAGTTTLTFTPRSTTSLRLTVTSVSGALRNIGTASLKAYAG